MCKYLRLWKLKLKVGDICCMGMKLHTFFILVKDGGRLPASQYNSLYTQGKSSWYLLDRRLRHHSYSGCDDEKNIASTMNQTPAITKSATCHFTDWAV